MDLSQIIPSLMPLIIVIVVFGLYLLPTIIAFKSKHLHRQAVAVMNICVFFAMFVGFGATVLMWFACLIWSLLNQREKVICQRQ